MSFWVSINREPNTAVIKPTIKIQFKTPPLWTNTGAKRFIKNAFEIIHIRTGENPIQVLVTAVKNTAPGEDTTRISYGGIAYHQAVDISPQRRVDLALRFLSEGTRNQSFGNPKALDEYLAEELILASKKDVKSYAVKKRNEMERIARSSR